MNKIKQIGLTPDQYTALRWIHSQDNLVFSQSNLANLMSTDANNISGLVKRMEKLKLIERTTHDSDKRQKNIISTKRGTSLFNKGRELAEELEENALSCFSNKEKIEFKSLLLKLAQRIEKEKIGQNF